MPDAIPGPSRCPWSGLVHPEPSLVPAPTSSPATTVIGTVAGKVTLLRSFNPSTVTRSAQRVTS